MARLYQCIVLLIVLLSLGGNELGAQNSTLPVPFGPANSGRDFWVAFPANWDGGNQANDYVRLYITSAVRTPVRIWTGKTIRKVLMTKPNDVVTMDLTLAEAQTFTRRDTDPIPADQIYKKKAVHIQADAPIVVYGINRTSNTSDGMLLLPTNALGRRYVVASYAAVIGVTQEVPSQFMITAPYNGTQITVKQPMRSPNHPEGSTVSFTLDSGDVYSAMSVGYNGDMSGAEISASKPVAVTAGQNCAYIPNQLEFCCCDHIEEQMLPVESWGKVYHGVPFSSGKNGDIWRVFASQPNTQIWLNGAPFAKLNEVGGQRGDGWIEYRANPGALVEWSSDKPIYAAQYNASQDYDGDPSDPFYLVLTPLEQYQKHILFSTPSSDFPHNFINLVADSACFQQMEIASAGGENWERLAIYGGVDEVKKFPTHIGGTTYIGVRIDIRPGTYRLRGPRPFAGYLYGFSDFHSYGYPLSVATANRGTSDTIAPTIVKSVNSPGNVKITATDQPNDAAVRTNIATIEMDPGSSFNYDIVVDYFEPGVVRTVAYTLKARDRSRPARAIVYISDAAGNTTIDTVEYAPVDGSILATSMTWPARRVGTGPYAGMVYIKNTSTQSVTINGIAGTSSGDVADFRILNMNTVQGRTLNPGDSVTVDVEFWPQAAGSRQLNILWDVLPSQPNPPTSVLTGVGVRPLLSTIDMDFGAMTVDDAASEITRTVRFWLPLEQGFIDSVNITGLEFVSVSANGVEDFRSVPLTTAVVLKPEGQTELVISGSFIARAAGVRTASVRAITTDGVDTGSHWVGVGIAPSSGVSDGEMGVSGAGMVLKQNQPNPVTSETTIGYTLGTGGQTTLRLYDTKGSVVRSLVEGYRAAGRYEVKLEVRELASGSYYYTLVSGGASRTLPLRIVR